MALSCQPKNLLALAKCFSCFTPNKLRQIRTYLTCQWGLKSGPFKADITDASVSGNIVVVWTAASPTPSNYEVWRSKNGGVFSLFTTVAGTVLTTTDPGVMVANDLWTYEVRPTTGGIAGAFSNTVSIGKNFSIPTVGLNSFPDLVRIDGPFGFTSGLVFTVSAPLLRTISGQVIMAPGITSLSVPALTTIGTNLDLNGCTNLTTLTITALKTVGLVIDLTNCTALTSFNAPALLSTGSDIDTLNMNAMTSFSAPVLTTVGGQFALQICPLITSVSLPSLVSVAADFDAFHCAALTSISLPVLTIFGGRILCGTAGDGTASVLLNTFSIPNAKFSTPGVLLDWAHCALLVASVNQILARGVATGVALTTADFELDVAATNAAPAGQGLVDKATLQGQGNTVVTN